MLGLRRHSCICFRQLDVHDRGYKNLVIKHYSAQFSVYCISFIAVLRTTDVTPCSGGYSFVQ